MNELRVHVHGMDCAEEAALIRRALAADPGVATIDFDLINAFVHVRFDPRRTSAESIQEAIRRTGFHAHEPAASETADGSLHTRDHHHPHGNYSTVWTVLSGALLLVGWAVEGFAADHWFETFIQHSHDQRAAVFYALSALVGLWPMWPRALASLRWLQLDMHVLVCLSVIGAAAIGEWSEGAAVAFLFALAHRMEAWSIERARAEIAALAARGVIVAPQEAQNSAPVERWIERFAAVYTPVVTGGALALAVGPPLFDGQWSVWFYRALVLLVLGCPCALIISTPVTVVAAVTSAARHGVLIKGGAALERAAYAAEESINAGDVVFARKDEESARFLARHARRAMNVIRQNVALALLTKAAFLVTAPFGAAPLWMAVLADTGATVLVTLNGLRLLRPR